MTIDTSALAKYVVVFGFGISIPLALHQSNSGSAIAGFVGGATAATVVSQFTKSRKRNKEKDILTIENSTALITDEKPIDLSLHKGAVSEKKISLIELLAKKGIKVIEYRQARVEDKVFDPIAIYLGKHYSMLEKLQKKIKASIANKTDFTFNLYGESQKQIQSCTQYCRMLNNATLISHYHYDKRKKIIHGNVQRRGDIIQFLNGVWFERAILNLLKGKFTEAKAIEFLVNPKLKFANGDLFELDILLLADNQLFWIECKTGNHYNDYLPKYCQHREKLGLAKEHTFLVGLGLSKQDASKWTKLWKITVVNQDGLLDKI